MTNIVYSSVAFWILVKDDGGWVGGSVAESVKALKAYNSHSHPFNGPLSGTTRVNSEWQWHQLGHMQACTSLQTDNNASTQPLSFSQAGCPSCYPTNSVKALKAYSAMNKPECHRFCTRLCKQVKATNHSLVIKYSRSGCFVRLHILCQEATTTASCAVARGRKCNMVL